MCNCLSETKEMLAKSLADRAVEGVTIHSLEYNNIGILKQGNKLVTQPVLTASYKADRLKRDGVTTQTAKASTTITFTYCPFCGVKYSEE